MGDRIELRGLRAVGAHGATEVERRRAQPFEVDLDIEADLQRSGHTDELADTIDYGGVVDEVVGILAGAHMELLERMAQRIADTVLATAGPLATVVTVTVRKLRPPVAADLATAAVTITRSRPA